LALTVWVPAVRAQSFTWNNFTGTATGWSTPGNWLGGVAPSFNGTETLTFSGTPPLLPPTSAFQPTGTYTVTVNGATNYGVNQMVFNNFGSPTTTSVTTTAGVTITSDTAGGTISFQGSNPAITQSGAGAVTFAQGTATTPITLTASGLTVNGAGVGDLQLLGTIGGTGNLTINQTGAGSFGSGATVFLAPTAGNTFVGSTTLVAGNLSVGGTNPFGPSSNVVNINGGLLTSGGVVTIANPLNLNGQLTANATFTFSGPISGNGRMLFRGGSFTQITNVVSGTGTIAINDPSSRSFLELLNGGTAANAGGYSLANGFLFLSNAAANATRLNPAATLAMNGNANLEIDANGSANTAEQLAGLALAGQGVINLSPTTTSATSLTFGSLSRGNNGMLHVVSQVASTSLGGTPGNGVANLFFTTSLAGDNVNGILPYAAAFIGPTLAPFNTFVRYDNTNGIVPLNLSTDYDLRNPVLVGNSPTANYRLPFNANTVGGINSPTTVNSLLMETPGSATFGAAWYGTGTLSLTSGALLTSNNSNFPSQPSFLGTVIQPNIALGSATGYFDTEVNTVLLGNITGTGGLAKGALQAYSASVSLVTPGSLTLAGNNSGLTGGLFIHGGSVLFSADNQLGAAGGAVTIDGGLNASLLFNPDNQFAPGTASAVTLNRPITLGAAGGALGTTLPNMTLTVAQPIGGIGGLIIAPTTTPGGVVRLTAANTYTGGTFIGNNATLAVNADAALGAPAGNVVLGVGTTFQTEASFTTARNFVINSSTSGATIFTAGNNLTMTGVISSVGSPSSSGLTKAGLGTLTLTAANSVTGAVLVGNIVPTRRPGSPYAQPGGSLVLSGPNGALAKSTEVVVYPGGQFVLDNSGPAGNINNNRLSLSQSSFTGATLQLAVSGEFKLVGNANGNVFERVGPMGNTNAPSGPGGSGIFTLEQPTSASGQNTNLVATSLNNPLSAGSTTNFFRGTNLGVTTAGTDFTTLKL
jgi:autotransporter-associated beta strand protein